MFDKLRQFTRRIASESGAPALPVKWVRKNSGAWLSKHLHADLIAPKPTSYSARIEKLASETNQLGPQPLWIGYANNNVAGPMRMPDGVRTAAAMGNIYTELVQAYRPSNIAEFGTAFGVSGMYFLAGIELNEHGHLLTFEPNEVWRSLAIRNLSLIGERFTSVAGTFEENISNALPPDKSIDLAFIDAIHTREFVVPQLEIVITRSSDHALIIVDDINFSGNMKACWEEISNDPRVLASAAIGERVGILELHKSRQHS